MLSRFKKIRIIVDTNLWISFLISRNYTKLDALFSSRKIYLLFSLQLLTEFINVATLTKFRKYFSEEDMDALLAKMKKHAKIIQPTTVVTHCRDPKDNFLLELAIDGKAHFLLTGDNDLLVLKQIGKTSILQIQDFFRYNKLVEN
jgi:putative PIN family toxin of toxin-antitoxin system